MVSVENIYAEIAKIKPLFEKIGINIQKFGSDGDRCFMGKTKETRGFSQDHI